MISIPIRDWNVRRAVMAGQSRKLMRYLDKQLEEVATLMREARQNGQNMTQFKRIMDMTNFDFRIQACPLCEFFTNTKFELIKKKLQILKVHKSTLNHLNHTKFNENFTLNGVDLICPDEFLGT